MQDLVNENKIPGINIWIKDKLQSKGSYGLANKVTKEAMYFDHYVRIGSVNKTFIGTAILQLVDQHKISLDDPISKYIGNVSAGNKITLRHFGSMRSGLPNYSENKDMEHEFLHNPNKQWNTDELLKIEFSTPNMFEPDTDYYYSNTNTVLLGLVIEKVSSQPLADYLNQTIFITLKLTHTTYPADKNLPSPYAHGYTAQTVDQQETDASL